MQITITRCDGCSGATASPLTVCRNCDPRGAHEEQVRMSESAEEARAIFAENYAMGLVAMTASGALVRVRDADIVMRCGLARSREDLIGEVNKSKSENRELLVENATLRRALERAERLARK